MDKGTKKHAFNWRSFASFVITLSFVVMVLSGLVLYFTPQGRVAHWTAWHFLGLDKEGWTAIHVNNSYLFLLGALIHIYLNWKPLLRYIVKKSGSLNRVKELVTGSAVLVVVLGGSVFLFPPFSTVMDINDSIKDYWARTATTKPPAPHAEDWNIQQLAKNIHVSKDEIISTLRIEGFKIDDPSLSLGVLADLNKVSPSDLYASLVKHFPQLRKGKGRSGKQDLLRGVRASGAKGRGVK